MITTPPGVIRHREINAPKALHRTQLLSVLRVDRVKDDPGCYAIFTEQEQKSWTSFQDYQDAQDKQQTQNPLAPRLKWKMLHRY